MSLVYVSLGSNVEPKLNIVKAVAAMRRAFGELRLSPVYQSAAVGFNGDDFLNMVAAFETDQPVRRIVTGLRRVEDELGRDRSQPRYSHRPIDLDILVYDDAIIDEPGIQVPRHEILKNAYVLKPLQDLAANEMHPVKKQSYRQLWQAIEADSPRLDLVELDLD